MSGVFQNIDPPPPHRPTSLYPPGLWCGGRTHSLGGEGGGGSIFWKTPDTALYSTYVSTLCSNTNSDWSNLVGPSLYRDSLFLLFFCPLPEHFPRGALVAGGEAVALRRARAPRLLYAWHAHVARGIQQVRRARFLHRSGLLRDVALRRARAPRLLCAWHAHMARSGLQHVRRARFLHSRGMSSIFADQ